MTLDTKRTFDALVERYSADEAARRRILENRFYQQVSNALAGSHEYMAMEKLLELSAEERFDLVVLDTPPTRHALDFLEAPDRLLDFLDTSVLRWFLKPYFVAGRLTLKVATRTGAAALKLADRFLGLQFLQEISEFFLAFEGMYEGFKERAARVHALLRREDAGFVLVASPTRATLDEALYFHRRLSEGGLPFVGFVVNRIHPDPAATGSASSGRVGPRLDPELAQALVDLYEDQRRLARQERRAVARLEVDTGETPVLVPEHEVDIHDLRGLKEVGAEILAATREGKRTPSRSREKSNSVGAPPSPYVGRGRGWGWGVDDKSSSTPPPRGAASRRRRGGSSSIQARAGWARPASPPPPRCAPPSSATAPWWSPRTRPTAWPTPSTSPSRESPPPSPPRSTPWRSTSTSSWPATGGSSRSGSPAS
jgi:anion-transporting  ArsA/GET3 family ATPase